MIAFAQQFNDLQQLALTDKAHAMQQAHTRNLAARAYEACTGVEVDRSTDEPTAKPRRKPTPGTCGYRRCGRPWWFGIALAAYLGGMGAAVYLVPIGLAIAIGCSMAYMGLLAWMAPKIGGGR